jgi:hypothetical protein
MIGGAHLSGGRGEGRRWPEVGALSFDGGGNRAGRAPPARGPTRPMERGGDLGKSGPVWKFWVSWAKIQGSFITNLVFLNFNGF